MEKTQIRTILPEKLAREFKAFAAKHGMKLYEAHEQAIIEYLKKQQCSDVSENSSDSLSVSTSS